MAAIVHKEKVSVALRLDNGSKSGVTQTVSVGLGTIDKTSYDDDKAIELVALLAPLLSKNLYDVRKTEVSTLRKTG